MDLGLKSKKVLVTGASQGIGLAIVEDFLSEGANVFLVSRGLEKLETAMSSLTSKYSSAEIEIASCDCTNSNALANLVSKIEKTWGGLDVVVANVGDGRSIPDALPDAEQWDMVWDSNFGSALNTARTFLPMLEKSNGCLLFISSITGLESFGAPTDYSTAKTALNALAKNLSRKLAPNVRVNVVAPGNVYFEGGSWDDKIKADKDRVDGIIQSSVPMKRFGTPEEIANAVIFLCSDKASFITGATLVVDGGQTVSVN